MIELVAITQAPAPELDDAELFPVESADLVALCSAVATEVCADALWRREELVEALMRTCDVLPVRFGTRVADSEAASRALLERRDELHRAFDRVRGSVELAVRVIADSAHAADSADGADAAPGHAYVRRLARDRELRDRLRESLAQLARESKETSGRARNEVMRSAYLVERDNVDAFVAEVAALERAHPGLSFLCTGPWPPYSFVGS